MRKAMVGSVGEKKMTREFKNEDLFAGRPGTEKF